MLLTESDVAFHSGEACTVWLKSKNVIMEAVNEGEHGPIYKDDIKTRLGQSNCYCKHVDCRKEVFGNALKQPPEG